MLPMGSSPVEVVPSKEGHWLTRGSLSQSGEAWAAQSCETVSVGNYESAPATANANFAKAGLTFSAPARRQQSLVIHNSRSWLNCSCETPIAQPKLHPPMSELGVSPVGPAPSRAARLAIWAIYGYRAASRRTFPVCRYLPSCSEYALEAVKAHGAGRGSLLAVKRLSRCRPFGGSGYDPVPESSFLVSISRRGREN